MVWLFPVSPFTPEFSVRVCSATTNILNWLTGQNRNNHSDSDSLFNIRNRLVMNIQIHSMREANRAPFLCVFAVCKQTPLDPGRPMKETESSTTSSLKLPSRPTSRTESKDLPITPFIPRHGAHRVIPAGLLNLGSIMTTCTAPAWSPFAGFWLRTRVASWTCSPR